MDITEEVIYHLSKNIKTHLRVSQTEGIGVFAIKDIFKGEQVFPIWEYESGIYLIPNDRISELPDSVNELLHKYFINEECGYKIIRLFKGLNFLFHGFSYCNSAYPKMENINIDNNGFALRDIKAGEEILEWYTENIDLANSK
jgi:SET domain-containing protein